MKCDAALLYLKMNNSTTANALKFVNPNVYVL